MFHNKVFVIQSNILRHFFHRGFSKSPKVGKALQLVVGNAITLEKSRSEIQSTFPVGRAEIFSRGTLHRFHSIYFPTRRP